LKVVIQRVSSASVRVGEELVASMGPGMLLLLCALRGDDETVARRLACRVAQLRFCADEGGRMDRSVLDTGGSALVVSQVTLAADGRKGRRPSLDGAAEPERARALCELFAQELEGMGVPTQRGRFGASMQVELVNDGPVTFVLEQTSVR